MILSIAFFISQSSMYSIEPSLYLANLRDLLSRYSDAALQPAFAELEATVTQLQQELRQERTARLQAEAQLHHERANSQETVEQKRAQAALAANERLLRTVVTNTPTILYAIDQRGIFTLSEGKGLEIAGLKPGELVGQSAYKFYQNYPNILESLDRVLAGEEHSSILEFAGVIYDNRATPSTLR